MKPLILSFAALLLVSTISSFAEEAAVDFKHTKELHTKFQRGETLTTDEQKIYDEARRRLVARFFTRLNALWNISPSGDGTASTFKPRPSPMSSHWASQNWQLIYIGRAVGSYHQTPGSKRGKAFTNE